MLNADAATAAAGAALNGASDVTMLWTSRSADTQPSFATPFAAARASGDAVLAIDNASQTYPTLADTTVTMTGRSELRVTGTSSPIAGSIINLNSPDAWFYMTGVKPSVVDSTYLGQIRVNGAAAIRGTNVRVVQYELGTVVIPHAPSFQPLQTFSGPQFTGTSKAYGQYTYYNTAASLGDQNRNISSFKLKRGYMATVATQANGTGPSKVYIAQDNDLDVSLMPSQLDNAVQFVRVLPWRWVSKKGASDLSPTTLDASWYYNWDNNQNSSLDAEYVPIRQQRYWPGLPTNKPDSTQLLGYNEPNNPVEDAYETLGNGSIDMAVSLLPELLSTGLRIGSPAVTDGGKAWLYEFMDKAIAANYRVDFIAIHNYQAGNTATSLYNWLKEVYDRYKLPIWLTEFNNGANWTTAPDPTLAQNATAIGSFIEMMDTTPWVERYSIYSAVEAVRQMTDSSGNLTPAGVVYKNNASPIGYVQEAVPASHTAGRGIAQLPLDANGLDTSGYGNNAQAIGAPAFVAGQRGQALQLDGSNSYLRLPENIASSNAFSFAAWVYWDGGADNQRVFDFGDDATKSISLTPRGSATGKMRFALRNGAAASQFIDAPIALPAGSWQHVAVTMSGTTARIYLNGVQQASGTITTPAVSGTKSNYLGKGQGTSDPRFAGRLDDVQIVDSVLTPTQIAAVMSNLPPQFASIAIARGPAVRGSPFNATIANLATDPDAGDGLTYGKASGPAWLTVAADGTLGGTPGFDAIGLQDFVVVATDSRGATAYAVLSVELGETYWRGDVNNSWTANNAGNTNWSGNASGTTDTGTVPGASTDVTFAANNAGNLPGTVLGADVSVRSVRVATATGLTIGGANNLTLGAFGVAVVSGAGATTINTSGQVILGANQTWTNESTNPITVTSVISGAASLTKAGAGALTITANNLYTLGTTIAAGTLQVGNGGGSGSIVGDVVNNGSFIVNRLTDVTLDGVISGTGTLTKSGSGRLTLTSSGTFSGGTTIGSQQGPGVVRATANGALGTGEILIGPGGNGTTARLELSNNITIPNAIALPQRNTASAAVQNISGNNRLSGSTRLTSGGGNAIFQSDAGLLTLGAITSDTAGRTATLAGAGNGLVNGVISNGTGTVAITKSGTGTWTLSAVNSYTGATTVTAGTLALGGAERIANTSPLVLSGGTLATNGFGETLGALSLSASSGINFGSGTGSLTASGLGTITAGTVLTITNWTQGADRLFIGTTAGLTTAQLAQINFNGTAALQLGTGEVVPATSVAPTVANIAGANVNPVGGTTTVLSALGADDGGEARLIYTWSVTNKPAGAADPTFSVNGTNAAKTSVATFSQVGTYTFVASILDGSGQTVTSSVSVVVNPTFSGIAPASSTIAAGSSISVGGANQFGGAMSLGSGVSWSASVGSITQAGVFTAPVGGTSAATITATLGATTYTTTLAVVAGRGWYEADLTGASLIDSSGSGNHGTLGGSYGYAAGRAGTALSLSGGAADLPDGIVSGLTDFTISTWVYLTANPSWARIFDFGTGPASSMFLTANVNGTNTTRFAITTSGGGGEQIINAAGLPLNTWTHVAVSLVGDVGTIYVNGVVAGTNANMTLRPASLGTTTNNYLGDSQYAADPALQGRLDDFRILGTGLNSAGIVALRDAWQAPTLAVEALATPSSVEGATTATLSALGASDAGEAGLTYTWSVLGAPPGAVTFSVNGTNAAKNVLATFAASGTFQLTVAISNTPGASVSSTVTLPVTLPTTASVTNAVEAYGVGSHTLRFTFDNDAGVQDWSNLVEIESTDGTRTVTPTDFAYDASTHVLTVTLPSATQIANGDYVATLKQGTLLGADYVLPFFMLAGDANHDRTVGFDDLLALAQSYGGTGMTYEQGDFNGDGAVDFDDLLVMAQNYSGSLATTASFSNVAIAAQPAPVAPAPRKRVAATSGR